MAVEQLPALSEWTCAACGERVVSQDVEAVEHVRSTHHCPTGEQIRRALRGEYDG